MATNREFTSTDLLELTAGLGQRQETYRFDVINPDLSFAFTATSVASTEPPQMSWDGAQSTQRVLRGVTFGPADFARIDPIRHRLRVTMVLDNGVEYPWGVFMFASDDTTGDSWGNSLRVDLYDQSVILNQPREASFSVYPGARLDNAMLSLVSEVGLLGLLRMDATSAAVPSLPPTWSLGVTRGVMLADLAQAAAFLPPYFDNNGFLRLRAAPIPLSAAQADLTYTAGQSSRIIAGSIGSSSSLVVAPNRYIVRGHAAASQEVTGIFDVPASAPHSKENIGYVRAKEVNNQAVTDTLSANAAAQVAYMTDDAYYTWVTFDTPPDPRDDGYMVINFLGQLYREQSWSLSLSPGARMSHKAYTVPS